MRTIFLFLGVLFLGGCSLWGIFDNKFSRTDWQIEKIVVNGEEYLSAQSLKSQALKEEKDQEQNSQQENNPASLDVQQTNPTNTPQPSDGYNTALPDSASKPEPKRVVPDDLLNIKEVSTMDFDQTQHRIYGIAGCNNYFANYNWKDDTHLEIGNAGMTRKLCTPDELTTFEFRFIQNFQGVFNIIKNGSSMILDNGKMQIYLQ